MSEICAKVLATAQDYWTTSPEKRTLIYPWLEEHIETCQGCAGGIQDVAEEMLDKRRQQV